MGNHCVYIHFRADDGIVFYVGKGIRNRARDMKKRSKFWHSVAKKHGVGVSIVKKGLKESEANELERRLIAQYGRRDLGTGTLVNMTDGGEGVTGRIGVRFQHTNEAKAKISAAAKGKVLSPDHLKKLISASIARHTGRKMDPEHKQKLLNAITGKPRSEAVKAKISQTKKIKRILKLLEAVKQAL